MTKCPMCGYDETQQINQLLVSHKMSTYVDDKGAVVGLINGDAPKVTFANGKVVTRQDLYKAPEVPKSEVKK